MAHHYSMHAPITTRPRDEVARGRTGTNSGAGSQRDDTIVPSDGFFDTNLTKTLPLFTAFILIEMFVISLDLF